MLNALRALLERIACVRFTSHFGFMLSSFEMCPPDRPAECEQREQMFDDAGLSDVFGHVDQTGFLYFMDSGGDNGLFGCKSSSVCIFVSHVTQYAICFVA